MKYWTVDHIEEELEKILTAMDESIDPDIPQEIMGKMNELSSYLGSVARLAAEGKHLYDIGRQKSLAQGVVKKSDSTGHIDSQIPAERKLKEFTEYLQQNLRLRINTLQSILSYKKSERDAIPR